MYLHVRLNIQKHHYHMFYLKQTLATYLYVRNVTNISYKGINSVGSCSLLKYFIDYNLLYDYHYVESYFDVLSLTNFLYNNLVVGETGIRSINN